MAQPYLLMTSLQAANNGTHWVTNGVYQMER